MNKVLKTAVAVSILGGGMIMYSSCKKELPIKNFNDPINYETNTTVDYSIIDSVSEQVGMLVYEIGLLDLTSYCSLKSILNSTDTPSETIGTVPDGQTITVSIPSLLPETELTINNTGSVPLRFCGSTTPGVDCGTGGIIVDSGQSLVVTLQDISPASIEPVALNVSHTVAPSSSTYGSFSINYTIGKMSQLSAIPSLLSVVTRMNHIDNFIINNPDFEVYMTDEDKKVYFEESVLDRLGYDVGAINNDCNAYNAGMKSCAGGFVTCAIGAAGMGPFWGVALGACGIALMYCVDAMDTAYPDCVSGSTVYSDFKELWSPKVEYICID